MDQTTDLEENLQKAKMTELQLTNENVALSYELDSLRDELQETKEMFQMVQKEYNVLHKAYELLDQDFRCLSLTAVLLKEKQKSDDKLTSRKMKKTPQRTFFPFSHLQLETILDYMMFCAVVIFFLMLHILFSFDMTVTEMVSAFIAVNLIFLMLLDINKISCYCSLLINWIFKNNYSLFRRNSINFDYNSKIKKETLKIFPRSTKIRRRHSFPSIQDLDTNIYLSTDSFNLLKKRRSLDVNQQIPTKNEQECLWPVFQQALAKDDYAVKVEKTKLAIGFKKQEYAAEQQQENLAEVEHQQESLAKVEQQQEILAKVEHQQESLAEVEQQQESQTEVEQQQESLAEVGQQSKVNQQNIATFEVSSQEGDVTKACSQYFSSFEEPDKVERLSHCRQQHWSELGLQNENNVDRKAWLRYLEILEEELHAKTKGRFRYILYEDTDYTTDEEFKHHSDDDEKCFTFDSNEMVSSYASASGQTEQQTEIRKIILDKLLEDNSAATAAKCGSEFKHSSEQKSFFGKQLALADNKQMSDKLHCIKTLLKGEHKTSSGETFPETIRRYSASTVDSAETAKTNEPLLKTSMNKQNAPFSGLVQHRAAQLWVRFQRALQSCAKRRRTVPRPNVIKMYTSILVDDDLSID